MLLFKAHLHNENLLIMATNFTAYTTNRAAEQQPHPPDTGNKFWHSLDKLFDWVSNISPNTLERCAVIFWKVLVSHSLWLSVKFLPLNLSHN